MLHTIRSEQIKLTTLRSTWWSVLVTVAASLASALLIAGVVPDDDQSTNTVANISVLFLVAAQLALIALMAMSLGAILRNSPAAITILALMSLGVEKTLLAIQKTRDVAQYLPFNAGARITQPGDIDARLSPWGGFGVFCVYAAALFLLAVVL